MPVGNEIKVEVTGLEELERNLRALPERLAQRTLASAGRKGIRPIQDAAQTAAPHRTGKLELGIVSRLKVKSDGVSGATVVVKLGLKTGSRDKKSASVFYGRFIEKGTKFIKPHPFMEPSFKNWAVASIKEFAVELERGIERAAKGGS